MSTPVERLKPSGDYEELPPGIENHEQARQYANDLLSLKPEAKAAWWSQPNDFFGGKTPDEMWLEDPRAVLEFAADSRETTAS